MYPIFYTINKALDEFNKKFSFEPNDNAFFINNKYFMSGDAEIYWGIIKTLQPKNIIEIGGGFSSILAHQASEEFKTNLVVIEPNPSEHLTLYSEDKFRIIKSKVQTLEPKYFGLLESGDILFIDSSHRYREGTDVWFLLHEVLPKLKSGVYVHFHDFILPDKYNDLYSEQDWNEQEELEKLIESPSEWHLVWCGSYIHRDSVEEMKCKFKTYSEMLKAYPKAKASSLWLVKR